MSTPKLFNGPMKCDRCKKVFPSESKHFCTSFWIQGLVKILTVFAFALLVGFSFGYGYSLALETRPVVVRAVVTCD